MSEKITALPNLSKSDISVIDLIPLVASGENYYAYSRDLFGGMPKSFATIVVAASDTPNADSRADYVCDGTADDVDIQLAIDALPATGGKVVLLEGTFYISATISLGDDTILVGMGDATVLELNDAVDATLLTNKNSTPASRHATGNFRISVRDFKVDGNKANQGAGADTIWCVGFSTVDTLRVENLNIINGWTAGLRTEFCTNEIVANNRVDDSGDDCISINEETYQAIVIGNIVTKAGQSGKSFGAPYGIEIQDGAAEIMVIGNYVDECEAGGIIVNLHAGKPVPTDIVISGNIAENTVGAFAGYGIGVVGLAGSIINNVIIANNICHTNPKGIWTDFVNNVLVEGNISRGNEQMGIEIRADSQYVKVANNYCYDNGAAEAANQIGIGVKGDDIIVEGNECRDTRAGASRTQQWGIYVYNTSANSVVKNNRVQNNSVGQIGNDGGAIVQNNIGYVTENGGTSGAIATGGTIAHGLEAIPTIVQVNAAEAGPTDITISVDATDITVNFGGGGNRTFFWFAKVNP